MASTDPVVYTTRQSGQPLTREFRLYLSLADKLVSPWHDIPLFHDEKNHIMNMIVEIAKDEFLTPLRPNIVDDNLRFVPNIFPHKGYPWNYGSFPQTWEDPSHIDSLTTYPGDGDALDVCELAGDVASTAQIKQVKILGAFPVIEDMRTDWKFIVVDITNPLSEKMGDVNDVERHMPGYLDTMLEWFRVYKVPEGSRKNEIGGDGCIKGREFAHSLVENCHKSWKKVLTEPTMETKVSMSDVRIEDNNLAAQIPKRPREDTDKLSKLDTAEADKSHYISPNWPITGKCAPRSMEV